MEPKNLNISWNMLWKLFFMVLLVWLLYLAREVIAAILLAIVISTAFEPAVSFFEKKRLPRILGTLLIYLAAIFVVGLIIYIFIPIALSEFNNLLSYLNEIFGSTAEASRFRDLLETLSLDLNKLTDLLFSGNISVIDIASRVFGGVIFVIAVFILSFYLTMGKGGVEKFLIAILPHDYETKAAALYSKVSKKIGKWLTGQLLASLIMFVMTFLGLWLLGVKYSLLLGLLAGVLELVPYVGPIFTGGLAVLISLGDSMSLAIYTLILFTIIQQLEGHVIIPLVMRYTTALNPVVVLAALLIGGKVFGIVGLILSVPIAVFFQEMVEDWADAKQQRRGLGL